MIRLECGVFIICLAGCLLRAQPVEEAETGLPQMPPAPGQQGSPKKSPVEHLDYFRALLNLSPAERAKTLAPKPEQERQRLLAKLEEYDRLPESEQKRRLETTEIYLYLRDLMSSPPRYRAEKLAALPAEYRSLIQQRLRHWDLLPQDLQKEVLENTWMMQFIIRFESSSIDQQRRQLQQYPEQDRKILEGRIQKWRQLPLERRQRMYQHFQTFFELPPQERQRTLEALSKAERQQMERVVQSFDQLLPEQRQKSIESLRRFTNLSGDERLQFLRNAERWQAMSPREKETWRNLIDQMPPPGSPPLPPFPPELLRPPPGHTNYPNPPSLFPEP